MSHVMMFRTMPSVKVKTITSTTKRVAHHNLQHHRRPQTVVGGTVHAFSGIASTTIRPHTSFIRRDYFSSLGSSWSSPLSSVTKTRRAITHSTTYLSAAAASPRQYALVVQGPPGMDVTKPPKPSKRKKKKKDDDDDQRAFKLVIVESPSKCKTISNILQKYVQENNLDYDFVVSSSSGHIRNIPKKKSSKDQIVPGITIRELSPSDSFPTASKQSSCPYNYIPTYEIIPGKERVVEEMKRWYDASKQLILATDPDREGEAIGWHLLQILEQQRDRGDGADHDAIDVTSTIRDPTVRVTFNEITSKAIVDAIEHPQPSVRYNLVQAQETRRILDRLAGFTVSPVLWKKISPGLSAGRVQSVGMALVVQRERQRLAFQESEYCSLKANFTAISNPNDLDNDESATLEGQLVSVNGKVVASGTSDFDPNESNKLAASSSHKLHLQQAKAAELLDLIQGSQYGQEWTWKIQNITSSQRNVNPPVPFITSSLQQEANRRLGLGVRRVMEAAQQLYEKGYISYMRTDSKHLSDDAHEAIKSEILNDYGGIEKYVFRNSTVEKGRRTKKKKKADAEKPDPQAAHEAIRPAIQSNGRFCKPTALPQGFDSSAQGLYRLIYQRTVASQMSPQVSNIKTITIDGGNDDHDLKVGFRSSGSVVVDPGFRAVYSSSDTNTSQELPAGLEEGESLKCDGAASRIHNTQPPARFTEASFVGELESLGVGRPSTYASTVAILRERAYVNSAFPKELSGGSIVARRAAGDSDLVGSKNSRSSMIPSLTAMVVTSLLERYCNMYVDPSFTARMEERLDEIANSEDEVSQDERNSYLHAFYYGSEEEAGLIEQIKTIEESVDPDDARRVHIPALESNNTNNSDQVALFVGPWGPYVSTLKKSKAELDESETEIKPTTASLPPGMATDLSKITRKTLDAVIRMKENKGSVIGTHPENGRVIRLKTGSYGAYLQMGDDDDDDPTPSTHTLPEHWRSMKSLDTDLIENQDEVTLHELLGIKLEDAIQYCNLPKEVCTMNDKPIIAAIGPYGPYLKYNNTFTSLKTSDGDVLTIDAETAKSVVVEGLNRTAKSGAGVIAELGEKDGYPVCVKMGRFGKYINWQKVNAKLPAVYMEDPSELPLEEAWELIEAKAANPSKRKSKAKGKKGKSDSNPPPKRPPSAYLLFCSAKRPEVAAKFKSLGDTSKELARLWREASEDHKQPFVEEASAAKASYEEEKQSWSQKTPKTKRKTKVRGGKKTIANESDAPVVKRPRSAYIFFCKTNRPTVAEEFSTLGDISKELARRWKDLDDDHKKEYLGMAEEDKKRYKKEKALQS